MTETARYAIYYVPAPDTALGCFGQAWLGWDIWQARPTELMPLSGFDPRLREATIHAPRLYGFHATLKAPMVLRPGLSESALRSAARDFASRAPRITGLRLQLSQVGRFLALTTTQPSPDLNALAAGCVLSFDAFRRPLQANERARRKPETLTDRQRSYLGRWGYPFVLDDFRFHLTLCSTAEPADLSRLRTVLAPALDSILQEPFAIDAIALVMQPTRDQPFKIVEHYLLGQ